MSSMIGARRTIYGVVSQVFSVLNGSSTCTLLRLSDFQETISSANTEYRGDGFHPYVHHCH